MQSPEVSHAMRGGLGQMGSPSVQLQSNQEPFDSPWAVNDSDGLGGRVNRALSINS